MITDAVYLSNDVMEFFFGDELLDIIALHFLYAFLQLDLEPLDFFPHLREWHFLELFEHLGRERLHDIAEVFSRDPYEYRKGWPDLTLWRDGEVVFKEVKAPGDQLHASQRKTIRDVLVPLGYSVTIVDVVHADADISTTE